MTGEQKRISPEREQFEEWARREGAVNLKPARNYECEDGRFPATYYYAPTETAWRAWANKPALQAASAAPQEPWAYAILRDGKVCGVERTKGLADRWEKSQAVPLAPIAAPQQEPIAWGAFYVGGKRDGRLYSQTETEAQIDAYIAQVHQSDDSITLRKGPLYAAPQPAPVHDVRADVRANDIDDRYAGRLAMLLECMLIDPNGYWNEAARLLDEYKAEWDKVNPPLPTFMGEQMPPERKARLMAELARRKAIAAAAPAAPEQTEGK